MTEVFESFFEVNNSNINYEKDFVTLKIATEMDSPIKYDTDGPSSSINSSITINDLNNSLK